MLILVRHGRTAANAGGLLQGRLDLPLDDVGVHQAAQVAAALPSPHLLVASSLQRAQQTADAISEAHAASPRTAAAVKVVTDDRWIELSYGIYEGKAMSEVGAATWGRWRTDNDFAPEGGESLAELRGRVVAACEALAPQAIDHDVVVVTHVSPMKAAVAWALGVDVSISWRCHLDHASVCRIGISADGRPSLRTFNERLWTERRG